MLVLGNNLGSVAQVANENGVCGLTKSRAGPDGIWVLLKLVGKAHGAEGWFHPPKPACLEPSGKDQGAGNAWGGIPHPGYWCKTKGPSFLCLSK